MHPEVLAPETAACFLLLKDRDFMGPFYLAGGTAVALLLGHRQSVDLDFFSKEPFDVPRLQQQLKKCGSFILDEERAGTLHGVLNGAKVSFLEYDYPLIEPLISYENVPLAGLKDLACMKLEAIASRGKKRDFLDVYAITQQGHSLGKMLGWFEKKYQSVQYNQMHLLKSMTYFADAEEDPPSTLFRTMDWLEVKKFFEKEALSIIKKTRK